MTGPSASRMVSRSQRWAGSAWSRAGEALAVRRRRAGLAAPGARGTQATTRELRARLGTGCAEQGLVGGTEVGYGQPIRIQLPDLLGDGDGDLDVLAAAGDVEALGVRAELRLGVQRLVADGQQSGGGDPVAESVRGHGRGLHVHGE